MHLLSKSTQPRQPTGSDLSLIYTAGSIESPYVPRPPVIFGLLDEILLFFPPAGLGEPEPLLALDIMQLLNEIRTLRGDAGEHAGRISFCFWDLLLRFASVLGSTPLARYAEGSDGAAESDSRPGISFTNASNY